MTALDLRDVSVRYDDRVVLGPVDLRIEPCQRWVVLGPNGSGKTTLVRVAALLQFPTTGVVEVLGTRWGSTDIRALRGRIGLTSSALIDELRPAIPVLDVVMSVANAALETWWHTYGDDDRAAALAQLERFGVGHLADHAFGTLASGERQRVLLARAYANDPGLVVLDEPTAGLDLGGREELLLRLDRVAADPSTPPVLLITHHVEEIPPSFTHALLLRRGSVVAAGAIEEVLDGSTLSACFGLDVTLAREGGRWWARSALREDGLEPGT
ncbi:MAG: ATP-binding cassette domain-containing protein [Actinomycetota bacterium]